MNSKTSTIISVIAAVLGLIGTILFVLVIAQGDEAITTNLADGKATSVGPYVQYAVILCVLTTVIAVLFSVLGLVKNPAALKKSIIGIVALLVVLGISYGMASDGEVLDVAGNVLEGGEKGSTSKWVSTLINMTFILLLTGIASIGGGFIKSLISK
jgi:hypothetical protein